MGWGKFTFKGLWRLVLEDHGMAPRRPHRVYQFLWRLREALKHIGQPLADEGLHALDAIADSRAWRPRELDELPLGIHNHHAAHINRPWGMCLF